MCMRYSRVPTILLSVGLLAFLLSAEVRAVPTNSLWSGALSTDSLPALVQGSAPWSGADDPGFRIEWEVTKLTDHYNYVYTITNQYGGSLDKPISALAFEVGEDLTSGDIWNLMADATMSGPAFIQIGPYSPIYPAYVNAEMYAVRIEPASFEAYWDTVVVDFDSGFGPMWGSFHAKDGSHLDYPVFAHNEGLGLSWYPDQQYSYIAVPGVSDVDPIPAPSALLLGGCGIGAIGVWRRRKAL